MEKNTHLAKLRVASSNPVFRSIVAGQNSVYLAMTWRGHPVPPTAWENP